MNRRILVILPCLLVALAGCAGFRSYNTPFINTDETLRLREGLTADEVRDIVGVPLVVIAGDKDTRQVIWIYEVRGLAVRMESPGTPTKRSVDRTSTGPIHRLQVVFVNDVVHHWGPFDGSLPAPFADPGSVEATHGKSRRAVEFAKAAPRGPTRPRQFHLIGVYQMESGSDPMTVLGARLEVDVLGRFGLGGQAGVLQYPDRGYWGYYDYYTYGGDSEFWYGGYVYADAASVGAVHLIPSAGITYWNGDTNPFIEGRLRANVFSRIAIEAGGGYIPEFETGYYTAGGVVRF